jgi:hypothetical protein
MGYTSTCMSDSDQIVLRSFQSLVDVYTVVHTYICMRVLSNFTAYIALCARIHTHTQLFQRRMMRPLRIRIKRAFDLPVTDWATQLSDPYIVVTVHGANGRQTWVTSTQVRTPILQVFCFAFTLNSIKLELQ